MADSELLCDRSVIQRGFFLVIACRTHPQVTQPMSQAAVARFVQLGVVEECVEVEAAPDVSQVCFYLHQLLSARRYLACVVLGCLLEQVDEPFSALCQSVSHHILSLSVRFGVPVANGILTVQSIEQAQERIVQAVDFANVAVHMACLVKQCEQGEYCAGKSSADRAST